MATTALEWTSTAVNNGFVTPDNVAAADDSRATGGVAGEDMSIELDNAPGDYSDTNSGNTVTLTVQARTQGTIERQKQIVLTLTDSGGTAITDSVGADITFTTSDLTATDADYTSSAFTLSDNYTAANVNGWRLQADVTEGGGMPDSATVEIDYLAVSELQYDLASQQFTQDCDATVAATASITKDTSTTEAAAVSASTSITRDVTLGAKTVVASNVGAISKQTAPGDYAVVTSNIASMTPSLVFLQTVDAVVSAVADVTTATTFAQTCAAVVAAATSTTKQTQKILAATVVASSGVVKDVSKTFTSSVSAAVNLVTAVSFRETFGAVVGAVVGLVTEFTAGGGGGGGGPAPIALIKSVALRAVGCTKDVIKDTVRGYNN